MPEPETVASHMYRMAMLAMTLQDDDIDHMKCVQMALVHDLGEAIAGDITPHCGVSDEVKFQLEEKVSIKIVYFHLKYKIKRCIRVEATYIRATLKYLFLSFCYKIFVNRSLGKRSRIFSSSKNA